MKKWLLYSTLVLCISCGTLPQKNSKYIAKTSIELGVIGIKKTTVRKTVFQTTAIPKFIKKIRVAAQILPFTKQRLKKYNKSLTYLGKKNALNLAKQTTPVFVKLQVLDNVAVIEAINNKTNNQLLSNYIQHTTYTRKQLN